MRLKVNVTWVRMVHRESLYWVINSNVHHDVVLFLSNIQATVACISAPGQTAFMYPPFFSIDNWLLVSVGGTASNEKMNCSDIFYHSGRWYQLLGASWQESCLFTGPCALRNYKDNIETDNEVHQVVTESSRGFHIKASRCCSCDSCLCTFTSGHIFQPTHQQACPQGSALSSTIYRTTLCQMMTSSDSLK